MWNLISETFSRLFYSQPRRIGAQSMGFSVTTDLAPDGSNLTTVIATLYNNYRETTFRELEAFICSAFPEIGRIDVTMVGTPPTATVQIVYGEGEGLKVPLQFCGTGIEQLLMLATAVLTSQQDPVFLIDA